MHRVLITGANGFVGSALVQFLKAQDCELVTASRAPIVSSVTNFAVGEMTNETQWSEALSGVNAVIHLAGRGACHGRVVQRSHGFVSARKC